jgi:uncharacterized BrkB/YihY/UPF0761 family membrane protein
VFVTILGFVLLATRAHKSRSRTRSSAQFPIIGSQLKVHALQGRSLALIGLATWAGLGITQAAQNAFDRVWAIPFKDRRDFIHSRLRGLALLVALWALFIVATLASGLVTGASAARC